MALIGIKLRLSENGTPALPSPHALSCPSIFRSQFSEGDGDQGSERKSVFVPVSLPGYMSVLGSQPQG